MIEQGEYIKGVTLIHRLKRRTEVFLIAIAICILLVAIAYVFFDDDVIINFVVVANIIFMGILLIMIIRSYKNIVLAKLIIDNRIMHIKQAEVINQKSSFNHRKQELKQDIEVFISCFGILLNSEVIKYNLDGILLKEVKLSDRYITLNYGRGNIVERTRINHETLSILDTIRITERFRFETGVTPVLVEEN